MNKHQKIAIERFRHFLEGHIRQHDRDEYGRAVTVFGLKEMDYGVVWINAQVENTSLDECNLLRAMTHEWWHVLVGPRGRLTVYSCPNSFKQFKNRYAFGMLFNRNVA